MDWARQYLMMVMGSPPPAPPPSDEMIGDPELARLWRQYHETQLALRALNAEVKATIPPHRETDDLGGC